MRRYPALLSSALAMIVASPALADQPFSKEEDIRFHIAWVIDGCTISTAVYATLDSPTDVDYFTFEGELDRSMLLQITIPEIKGKEDFAPQMPQPGCGLAPIALPDGVTRPDDAGGVWLPPPLARVPRNRRLALAGG